jgi:nitroreductase
MPEWMVLDATPEAPRERRSARPVTTSSPGEEQPIATKGWSYVGPEDAAIELTLHPLLRERRSSRIFDPAHALDEDTLAVLLEAARWAPSAGNSQPWAFVVARRGEPAHARMVDLLSRSTASWAPDASAIVLTLHRTGHDEDPGMTYSDYAAYDLGQAVASLTVQAQALGLLVHQFAGFDHAGTALAFAVPDSWTVTTMLAIGRQPEQVVHDPCATPEPAARERHPRERKRLAEFVFGDRYGVPRWP